MANPRARSTFGPILTFFVQRLRAVNVLLSRYGHFSLFAPEAEILMESPHFLSVNSMIRLRRGGRRYGIVGVLNNTTTGWKQHLL